MKKQFRVKDTREFQKIISKKNFVTSGSFVIYLLPKGKEYSRVGISVGKKLGNAVNRNKIKRQVRMMLQDLYDFDGDFDGILMVRNLFIKHNFQENKKELENLLKKVKMYKNVS